MVGQRLLTQLRTKNFFTSYGIITKTADNQTLFINQFNASPIEFLETLIDQILIHYNDTYVRYLSEPEKELYMICAEKWYQLYELVLANIRLPLDGKIKSKTVVRWLSPLRGVGFAIKNDECFLVDRNHTKCDSKTHTDGLVMCRHFDTCGFISRCSDKMAHHRCTGNRRFERHHIDPTRSFEYKRAYVMKIVRDAVKLKPFTNSRLAIFPDRRRSHQIPPRHNIRALARQNQQNQQDDDPIIVDLENEDEANRDDDVHIEEIFPPMHRK